MLRILNLTCVPRVLGTSSVCITELLIQLEGEHICYSCLARRNLGVYQNSNLSGCPAKSGPLDFGTKNNFPSFFVSEKGLVHIYKNATYYFPVSHFCLATSQN